jgi:hypothetical protein
MVVGWIAMASHGSREAVQKLRRSKSNRGSALRLMPVAAEDVAHGAAPAAAAELEEFALHPAMPQFGFSSAMGTINSCRWTSSTRSCSGPTTTASSWSCTPSAGSRSASGHAASTTLLGPPAAPPGLPCGRTHPDRRPGQPLRQGQPAHPEAGHRPPPAVHAQRPLLLTAAALPGGWRWLILRFDSLMKEPAAESPIPSWLTTVPELLHGTFLACRRHRFISTKVVPPPLPSEGRQ